MLCSDESLVIGMVFLGCLNDICGDGRKEMENLLEI